MEKSAKVHPENSERLWFWKVSCLNSSMKKNVFLPALLAVLFQGRVWRAFWSRRRTSLQSSSEKGNHNDDDDMMITCHDDDDILSCRQGEPILVQNLFNVAILNVLWVIVASHR